jgi:hypothetical protein
MATLKAIFGRLECDVCDAKASFMISTAPLDRKLDFGSLRAARVEGWVAYAAAKGSHDGVWRFVCPPCGPVLTDALIERLLAHRPKWERRKFEMDTRRH